MKKKLVASILATMGASVGLFAQGVVGADGSLTSPAYPGNLGSLALDSTANTNPSDTAASGGLVFINGTLDTSTDINLELDLGSNVAFGSATIVDLLLGSGGTGPAASDIAFYGSGGIFDNSGAAYYVKGTSGGQTIAVTLFGWTGNGTSYASALDKASVSFNLGLGNSSTGGPGTTPGVLGAMPALNLTPVPEPTTFALMGLGSLGLLLYRRRS